MTSNHETKPSLLERLRSRFGKGDAEVTDKRVNPTPHGPQKFKYRTAGQQRRQLVRDQVSAAKKKDRGIRREHFKNTWDSGVIISQLAILSAPERYGAKHLEIITNSLKRRFVEHNPILLTRPDEVGSAFAKWVDLAYEHYTDQIAFKVEEFSG